MSSIVKAAEINSRTPEEVLAYCHYLTSSLQKHCGTLYPLPGDCLTVRYLREGECWLEMVEKNLAVLPPSSKPEVLDAFDLMHRICRKRPASAEILEREREAVLREYLGGNHSISSTRLMEMLGLELSRKQGQLRRQYVDWYFSNITEWCDTLAKDGTFPELPAEERYPRLSILLRENLTAYFGRDAEKQKQQWARGNISSNPEQLSPAALSQYIVFLTVAAGYLPDLDTASLRIETLRLLAANPDQHPLDQHAFALDYEIEQGRGTDI